MWSKHVPLVLAVWLAAGCSDEPPAERADADETPPAAPAPDAAAPARPDASAAPGPGDAAPEADLPAGRDAAPGGPADGPRGDALAAEVRSGDGAPDATPAHKPTIVAVGYGGLRILSRDLGLTWGERVAVENAQYGNETNLLRAVTYAAGLYVAVGQHIFTSPDGATWTERRNTMGNWLGGIRYGNGMFVGGGGCGWTIRSMDGLTWTRAANVTSQHCPSGAHRRSAAFGNGQFALAGDDRVVHVSTDAARWTVLSGLGTSQVSFCDGAFRPSADCPTSASTGARLAPGSGHGVHLRARGTSIERSLDGTTWRTVHRDTNTIQAFAFGFSP